MAVSITTAMARGTLLPMQGEPGLRYRCDSASAITREWPSFSFNPRPRWVPFNPNPNQVKKGYTYVMTTEAWPQVQMGANKPPGNLQRWQSPHVGLPEGSLEIIINSQEVGEGRAGYPTYPPPTFLSAAILHNSSTVSKPGTWSWYNPQTSFRFHPLNRQPFGGGSWATSSHT